jgi:hypothetical protein
LNLLVGIQHHFTRRAADVPAGQEADDLAALCFGLAAREHAALQQMNLSFAHRALQPQQEPVVEIPDVVDAVAIGQEGFTQSADFQQLVSIATRAGQTRHLHAQHQPDATEADLGDQLLEAGSPLRRGAGAAKIIINDRDALSWPSEIQGTFHQPIRKARRLLMAFLLRCRAGFHLPTGQVADQNRQLPSPLCWQARPCHSARLYSVVHVDARIPSGPEPAKLSGPPEVYRSTRNALQRFQEQKVESFFNSLKTELVHRTQFRTRREAKAALFEYIEIFYNRRRRHSRVGYRTPAQAHAEMLMKAAA